MPSIALFLDAEDVPSAVAGASRLGPVPEIIVRFDGLRGHDARMLVAAAGLAASLGARLAVEAIFDALDPAAEAKTLFEAVSSSGIAPAAILVAPRREFRTRPSNMLPDGEWPVGALVDAVRLSGITAPVGAGTPSLFTEFNRNPPAGDADFVYFGNAAIVHAADDLSVMETLSVYPSVIATARRLCPGKPVWLGPCTIGLRHNPYGEHAASNPALTRVPAAGDDPRQRALFGAAFAVGVAAQAASAGVDHLILAAPTGRFGLLDADGRPLPIQAVHAELAAASGAERHDIAVDHPAIAAVAYRAADGLRILIANLTDADVELALPATVGKVGIIEPSAAISPVDGKPIVLLRYRTMLLTASAPTEREQNLT